jgi:hypothetical protein
MTKHEFEKRREETGHRTYDMVECRHLPVHPN